MTHNIDVPTVKLLKTCFESEHVQPLQQGEQTHDAALRFVGQLVHCTKDPDRIKAIVGACLLPSYDSNTREELDEMIQGAIEKGFGDNPLGFPMGKKKASPADVMIAMMEAMPGVQLFRDGFYVPYISIAEPNKGPTVYALKSDNGKLFLKRLYFNQTNKAIARQDFDQVVDTLCAKALFSGPKLDIFTRVGEREGKIYIYLADDESRAVVIDENGFKVTREYPPLFVKMEGVLELPTPIQGTVDPLIELRSLLSMSDSSFYRLVAYLINCLKPTGPYFSLLVEGEQGSGKSFFCFLVKALLDPSQAPKLRLPDTERDLMIMAKHNHVLVFDNISTLRARLSDAFCTLSTGGGFATRKLYTDDNLQYFMVTRPYVLNGITGIANRPDILERAIAIKLRTMPEGQRKTEDDLMQAFEELRPRLLARLYGIVACALKNFNKIKAPTTVRMADAAKWIVAAEEATGFAPGTLLGVLEDSQQEIIADRMAENPIATALYQLVEKSPHYGRVGDLFELLKQDDRLRYDQAFPKTSMHFSKELDRLRPALEKTGIIVNFCKKQRDGKYLTIRLEEQSEERVAHVIAMQEYKEKNPKF